MRLKFFLIISCFILLCSTKVHSQLKYFLYEGKMGLIETKTLETYAEPRFDPYWYLLKGKKFGFKSNDSFFVFEGNRLTDRVFKIPSAAPFAFWNRFTQSYNFHVLINEHSAVINEHLDTLKLFNKSFNRLDRLAFNRYNYLFISDSNIDIYKLDMWEKAVVENIKASAYAYFELNDKVKSANKPSVDNANSIVFYGNSLIYVFNAKLECIKKIPFKTLDKEKVIAQLSRFYKVESLKEDLELSTTQGVSMFWDLLQSENDINIYLNSSENSRIKLNKNYKMLPVIDENRIEILNILSGEKTNFFIDNYLKIAYLPKTYLEKINFEFVD